MVTQFEKQGGLVKVNNLWGICSDNLKDSGSERIVERTGDYQVVIE